MSTSPPSLRRRVVSSEAGTVSGDNERERLRAVGRTTRSISREEQDAVLTLPSSAMRNDGQGTSHVFVVADGVAQKRTIETGSDNGIRFAVLRGLTEEDMVIVGGNVVEGSAVRVINPGVRR